MSKSKLLIPRLIHNINFHSLELNERVSIYLVTAIVRSTGCI